MKASLFVHGNIFLGSCKAFHRNYHGNCLKTAVWLLQNFNVHLSKIYKYTEARMSAYIIKCCQYRNSCRLAGKHMLISMQWATFQSKACKQKRRMTHKQKYQRKLLLGRIYIVCSYVWLLKAPFDFQINEQYGKVKSDCQNVQTVKLNWRVLSVSKRIWLVYWICN